jgi:hypothetical protein
MCAFFFLLRLPSTLDSHPPALIQCHAHFIISIFRLLAFIFLFFLLSQLRIAKEAFKDLLMKIKKITTETSWKTAETYVIGHPAYSALESARVREVGRRREKRKKNRKKEKER